MAESADDIKKKVLETSQIVENTLKSVAAQIGDIFQDALNEADGITKIFGKDVEKQLKSLARSTDKMIDNQLKINAGQASSKDISKQILDYKVKREILEKRINNLTGEQNDLKEQLNRQLNDVDAANKDYIEGLNEQLKIVQKQEKAMGNLGNLVKGLNKIPIVGQFIQTGKVMEAMQEEAAKTQDKTKVMAAGFKAIGKSIKEGILDPLTIVTFIFNSLLKGSTGIAAFEKSLGVSYGQAYKLNTQLNFVGNNVFDAYINGEKLKKSFIDLSESMGFVADYGSQALVSMTNLTGRLGLSNTEAAQLTTLSRMQSTNTEAVLDNVGKTVSAMNKQGKTTILLKDVMKEVASTSKATAVSLGSNPVKIAQAVVAAKQLGTTLQQMESTADSLLNFESSIEDELKAELLTGKQMNLERARAAALSNDMKTLSEEIGKNEEVIGAFASGNRLAQEATAKALGMNREQLAAMVYQQEAMKIGADGVRAKYGEQAYEQLKAQSAQEKFTNAVEKLKSAFSSVIQIASPLIDLLAGAAEIISSILSKWYILYPLIGLVALSYLPKIASSFANVGKSVMGIGTSIKENFTKLFSKGGFQSMLKGEDKTKETAEKAAGAGDKAGAGGPKAGEGTKNTLKGISAGIASFNKVSPADILKVVGSALALVALTPAIPALLLLQFVNGKAIQSALTGIGAGFKSIGNALSSPKIILGIAVFTLALMGIGKAIQFIAPTIETLGNAISKIVTSIATGISSIVTSLGDMISKLGQSLPSLLLLGPALFGISAGLAAMSFSGILALPTILALTALGAVAPALSAIGIGGEEKENINTGIDLTPMIAAINEVKVAVDRLYNKDTSINMDGKKVGSTLTQGSYQVA